MDWVQGTRWERFPLLASDILRVLAALMLFSAAILLVWVLRAMPAWLVCTLVGIGGSAWTADRIGRRSSQWSDWGVLIRLAAIVVPFHMMLIAGERLWTLSNTGQFGFTWEDASNADGNYRRWLIPEHVILVSWSLFYALLILQRIRVKQRLETAFRRNGEGGDVIAMRFDAIMNSHFLFNTLASIMAQSAEPGHTSSAVRGAAEYLRFALRSREKRLISLNDELEANKHYAEIVEARFGESVSFDFVCDEDALSARSPGVLIQPLLENALEHGRSRCGGSLKVAVRISSLDKSVVIEVCNDCHQGVNRDNTDPDSGIGLPTLREVLQTTYGPAARLELLQTADAKVVARITIPRI